MCHIGSDFGQKYSWQSKDRNNSCFSFDKTWNIGETHHWRVDIWGVEFKVDLAIDSSFTLLMVVLTGLCLTRHVENIFKQIQTSLSKKGFGYCMQQRLLKARGKCRTGPYVHWRPKTDPRHFVLWCAPHPHLYRPGCSRKWISSPRTCYIKITYVVLVSRQICKTCSDKIVECVAVTHR